MVTATEKPYLADEYEDQEHLTVAERNFRNLTPEQQKLLPFTEGITILRGKKGSGKTMTAVAIAHLVQKHFGMEVVADFPLYEEHFGPFHYINLKDFVRTLRIVSETVKKDQSSQEQAVDLLMKQQAGLLTKKFIIFDEAYQYMDSRNPQDRVVKLFGYWISQIRHFQSALVIITPHTDMIDKRVNRQVDRLGVAYTDSPFETDDLYTHTIIDDIAFDDKYNFHFKVDTFGKMYDTHVMNGFRSSALNTKES